MILIAALLAAQPIAETRQSELWLSSPQSLIDLQTCVTREWVRMGRVTPIPMADGVMLDYQLAGIGLGGPGKPIATLEIHEAHAERKITIAYRHPWSVKNAYNWLRDTGKRCFPDEWSSAALPPPAKN